MTNKLLYNPKHLLKLQKNEILNEFRTRLSLEFYKLFKSAEKQIWEDKDQNFQFIENIISGFENELQKIENDLSQKVKAWSSIEALEVSNKIKIPKQNTKIIPSEEQSPSQFASIQANSSKEEEPIEFEDFDLFDES